jgi:predicted DNA-binding ribbon-helix-helix protein
MTIVKHSLAIAGHRTSVSLEQAFWDGLKTIATKRSLSISALVAEIDSQRGDANLSSALRVYVLKAVQDDTDNCKCAGLFADQPVPEHLTNTQMLKS